MKQQTAKYNAELESELDGTKLYCLMTEAHGCK